MKHQVLQKAEEMNEFDASHTNEETSMRKLEDRVDFLGTTTLRRMIKAAYDENDTLYELNAFSECMVASFRVEENPSDGDEIVYIYYHHKTNQTIMTNIEGDIAGVFGSSAGFEGMVSI